MRVQSINQQNFTGLWQNISYSESTLGFTHFYEGRYYHPFKGENDFMTSIIKPSREYMTEDFGLMDTHMVGRTKEVRIEKPLGFTEREYQMYKGDFIHGRAMTEKSKEIDKELLFKRLYNYMNEKPVISENEQSLFKQLRNFLKNLCKKRV